MFSPQQRAVFCEIEHSVTQALDQHSDIRLTAGNYTHFELHDQSRTIQNLPGPAKGRRKRSA